ncbi:hypothetical protein [Desulfatiglans anilini]|uniref:hypothetical protein n=1 Tax=Desulfatiglans anilini TaxID=90728 RepID=UPI000407EDAB|nr:hypothetical protein [Desulfatiglans anilini]
MGEEAVLVAIGCGRLPRILDLAARRSFVVFGALGEEVAAGLAAHTGGGTPAALPVYFYETG